MYNGRGDGVALSGQWVRPDAAGRYTHRKAERRANLHLFIYFPQFHYSSLSITSSLSVSFFLFLPSFFTIPSFLRSFSLCISHSLFLTLIPTHAHLPQSALSGMAPGRTPPTRALNTGAGPKSELVRRRRAASAPSCRTKHHANEYVCFAHGESQGFCRDIPRHPGSAEIASTLDPLRLWRSVQNSHHHRRKGYSTGQKSWTIHLVIRAKFLENSGLIPSRKPLSYHGPMKSALPLTSGHSICWSPMTEMRSTPTAAKGTMIRGPGMSGGTGSLTMPAGNEACTVSCACIQKAWQSERSLSCCLSRYIT